MNDHEKCEKEKDELENTLKELENQINDERNKNKNGKNGVCIIKKLIYDLINDFIIIILSFIKR